jgi:hypothetical protein
MPDAGDLRVAVGAAGDVALRSSAMGVDVGVAELLRDRLGGK